MKQSTIGKTMLSPLYPGSCVSYELCGNEITIRLLGLFPVGKIRIDEIQTLRLGASHEVPKLAFVFNWMLFYCWHPAYRPIYLLQVENEKSYFPRLDHGSLQQLRLSMRRCRSTIIPADQAA